jgi:hypothetical protein
MESEARLYLFVLTRFLNANRHPLRLKTLQVYDQRRLAARTDFHLIFI